MAKKQPEHVFFDDLNDHLKKARGLAHVLNNQDPACPIDEDALFQVSDSLIREVEAAMKLWEQHWEAYRDAKEAA